MKKLFLLLSVGSIVLSAGAQSSSVIVKNEHGNEGIRAVRSNYVSSKNSGFSAATGRTTSTGSAGAWFSFATAGNDGTSSHEGLVTVYPDSTLLVATATPAFNWWCHGIGTSLDPTSPYFSGLWASTAVTPPPFIVTHTNAYTVDSIEIVGFYKRIKNYTDTLYIDVVPARTDSAFIVTWAGASLATSGITAAPDTNMTLADPYYDYAHNGITTTYCPSAIRITKVLDAAAAIDTDAVGLNDWTFPVNIPVAAGGKVVVFAHFASGHNYPLNTNIDSANTWLNLTFDLGHVPLQLSGDDNGGLVSSTDERYHTANAQTLGGVEPILVPTYFFTSPTNVHDPWFNVHLKCPTCADVAVANVPSNLSSVSAYPNPSNGALTISYSLLQNSDVTVTLTNIVGEVVATKNVKNSASGKATFNTASLPGGVYAYSVIANGEHTAGTVVIAH